MYYTILKHFNKTSLFSAQSAILLAICLPVVTACIDVMAVSVGLNNIMQDLSVSITQTQWLLSGYTVGTAAFLIIIGKLADIYGRRRILLLGVAGFVLSSLIASMTNSIILLIICRMLQGVTSAMMMTTTISIITYLYAPKERSLVITKWSGALGLGMAVGPLIGGLLISSFNWRAIFLVNIPIGILSYYLIKRFIPESKDENPAFRINWLESLLLSTLLILFLAILSEGNFWGWFSFLTTLLISCFLVSLILFIFIEINIKNPIIDFSLFKGVQFNYAVICGAISYFCMYAWLFIFSVYLQNVFGMTPLKSGLISSAFSIAFMLSAKIMGNLISKIGCKPLINFGFLIAFFSFIGMSFVNLQTAVWQMIFLFFFLGIGITTINAPSMIAATANISANKTGIASGMIFTIRWMGGSIGVAICTLLYQRVSYYHFVNLMNKQIFLTSAQKIFVTNLAIKGNLLEIVNKLGVTGNSLHLLIRNAQLSLTVGLSSVCIVLAIMSAIGLFVAIKLPGKNMTLPEKT